MMNTKDIGGIVIVMVCCMAVLVLVISLYAHIHVCVDIYDILSVLVLLACTSRVRTIAIPKHNTNKYSHRYSHRYSHKYGNNRQVSYE